MYQLKEAGRGGGERGSWVSLHKPTTSYNGTKNVVFTEENSSPSYNIHSITPIPTLPHSPLPSADTHTELDDDKGPLTCLSFVLYLLEGRHV